jgi:hypothetical protein
MIASQIITGLGTLLGVSVGAVLGWWLKARSDKERDLRAEKRAAYVDLIQRLNAFQHALVPLRTAAFKRDEKAILREAERTRVALAEVDAAVSVVRLIVPAERDAELAGLMTVCISSMCDAAGLSGTRGNPDPFNPAFIRIFALARAELGLAE